MNATEKVAARLPEISSEEREMASKLVSRKGRFVIAAHLRPDGDAIGASTGLCRALRAAGRDAVCIGLSPISTIYSALGAEVLSVEPDQFKTQPDDTLVVVDCGTPTRLREDVRPFASQLPLLCIDHHEKLGEGFSGAVASLVEPEAGSASEIVLRIVLAAGLPVDRAAANAFWVGIATDTGRFTYASTSPATHETAAWLVGLGAQTSTLADDVWNRVPLRRLRLQARFIASLSTFAGGLGSIGILTHGDYAETGCDSTDSENFVDLARSVDGVAVSAFVRQVRPDGAIHVSLRSRSSVDVAALCAEWGGGGHKAAAGATFHCSLSEAAETVRLRIATALA